MQKLDKVTIVQAVFCLLVSGVGAGCGDDSKPATKLDAAVDGTADVAGDSAKTDTLAPADLAQADAPQTDTAKTDAPLPLDTIGLDGPALVDVGQGETALDSGGVDTGLALDVAESDTPTVPDASLGEAGTGADGGGAVDAETLTSANLTFRLDNQGAQTVYLRNHCWLPFDVTSLADGTAYANQLFCACECADITCTVALNCAPCAPPSGTAVAAGQTMDLSWKARKSTMESKTGPAGAFECVTHAPIATGSYRLAVTVYPTEADAVAETNGRVVQQSFVLGTGNATIAVSIL
jgi:hypothetical protein